MDFKDSLFSEFKKKFNGIFTKTLPDEMPAYIDSKDNIYLLKDSDIDLIKKSLKDNVNYLLNKDKLILNPEMFY